ncbi:ARL14 effector protein-like [Acanthaster planci]|uniref:ARL14 effector protein-like n=1 Tax=Acanthaster planci TaxID=133434 RepID=A0A8B7YSL2_ACAPL|nr:ARL14 effector protein-like [Acanthaster planci]
MAAPMRANKLDMNRKQEKKTFPVLSDSAEDIIINLVDDDDEEDEEPVAASAKEPVTQDQKDFSKLPEAAQKLLKSLEFKNPGRRQFDMSTFDPENSEREMRKLRRTFQSTSITQKSRNHVMYNEKGLLLADNRDLCDCLNVKCPGCFYPCEQCSSTKCGVQCRCNRKWVYNKVENESGEDVVEFDKRT